MVFYIDEDECEYRIYQTEDLQQIIEDSLSTLNIFVKKIASPAEEELKEVPSKVFK